MSEIEQYWSNQWRTVCENKEFEEYSQSIPQDFLQVITSPKETLTAIKNAKTIFDFGSGTGHLAHVLSFLNWSILTGSEISSYVVDYANKKYGNGRVKFSLDELNDNYDLIVTSNTLEHFSTPHIVINKLLTHCKHLLILVPYQEDCHADTEDGGAGHKFSFSLIDFDKYNVIEIFTFFSRGWTEGKNPLQLVVLLKGNL